ncbi:MAG: IPT/TIG domain-containing protein [Bacteroidota bacterium]|nr:IPT/TIG domain-containing protein [Bacteroidota bacterium]
MRHLPFPIRITFAVRAFRVSFAVFAALALGALLMSGCAKQFNMNDRSLKLRIDSISPASGPAGTPVLIYGTGFSDHASLNKVMFIHPLFVAQVDTNASFNVLRVYVPNSAYGGSGPVSIVVDGDSAVGPVFTYTALAPVPVISSVVYNGVFAIQGQNFDSLGSVVSIGGQVTPGFTYQNNGNGAGALIKLNYSPPAALDNPADVTVTVRSQVSNTYPFLFYPRIGKFSPDTVKANSPLTVTGTLFGNRTVASSIRAFYYVGAQMIKTYMSPDPTIGSWNTNSIQVNIPNYDTYAVGVTLMNFYLEVNVGGKTTNSEGQYFR